MKDRWQRKKLGDVLKVQNGYAFDSKGFSPTKGLPLVRIRSLKAGIETETRFDGDYDEKYVVRAGDLLVGMDGEFGCYEWKGEPALLNQRVCRLREFSGELVPRFLFYGVNDYLKAIEDITGYATVKHLSSKQILDIEFPVPPVAEQNRIVGMLDKAFAGIDVATANAGKNLQNACALFESHLQSIFTERGKGWVTKQLADCLQFITYGFTNPMPTTAEGPYMITAKNVVGGRIDYASTRRTSREAFDTYLTDKSRPNVGDVLLTKDGTLGRVAVVDQPDTCINQSVALLRPNGRMTPQFMRCLLSSSDYQQRMVDDAGGATIKHIYITRVDKMPVTFPESLQEQQKFVASLDSLSVETQRLANLYKRKLAALEALKKSLLHQAFTGNL